MQTKAKSNSVVTHERLESGSLRFHVRGVAHFDFDLSKVHQSNRQQAEVHGWIQRISDAAAMSRDPKTGLAATPSDKYARMVALRDHYEAGGEQWSRAGTGGTGKSLTIAAIAELKGVDYATAEQYVDDYAKRNYDGDRKEALEFIRSGPKVAERMAEMRKRTERPANVDADAALDELTGE